MLEPVVHVSSTILNQLVASATAEGIKKVVVGAVILIQGNVLLLQRRSGDFMGELVELPSGNVDPNETLLQTLVREVIEETRLEIISIDRYVGSFDYMSQTGQPARQFNFTVIARPGEIVLDPHEHEKYFLVPPTIDNLNWHNMTEETKQTILNAVG